MRLTVSQAQAIRQIAQEMFGDQVRLTLFGSRARSDLKGGDVDLLVDVSAPVNEPAVMMARLSARVSRALNGRKVDVLIGTPNLNEFAIHKIARQSGIAL
ncbi:MAG: nucleotidyltransferase domain-containing protein [Betaproteobacteria bacterium]|nr:nucleotidyltransferase domain-containing protein [Betaproteobacteria bacterium]